MPESKVKQNTKYLLIVTAIFILLILSFVNIKNLTTTKTVLGADTQSNVNEEFWNNFLTNNPNYIPGWLELQKTDKAYSLDPNFQL